MCFEGLKAEDLEERGRKGSVAASVAPLYDPAVVGHGARTLPPWGTTLGFLPSSPTAAGIWPHLAGQPIVGGTPTAVPHGGGRCIFLEIFGSSIYFFENEKKKYKKNRHCSLHAAGSCSSAARQKQPQEISKFMFFCLTSDDKDEPRPQREGQEKMDPDCYIYYFTVLVSIFSYLIISFFICSSLI
jgi:hypothetical protein